MNIKTSSVGVFLERIPSCTKYEPSNPGEAGQWARPRGSGNSRSRGFCLAPRRPPQGGVCERSAYPWSEFIGRAPIRRWLRGSTNGQLRSCEVNSSTISLPQPIERTRAISSVSSLFIEWRHRSPFVSGDKYHLCGVIVRVVVTHNAPMRLVIKLHYGQ